MGTNNSLVVYTALYKRLLDDIADCYVDSEPGLDWMKIQSRLAKEGLSFLTKTLPQLGKHFDRCLASPNPRAAFDAPFFEKKDGAGSLPKIFGWLFERVFAEADSMEPMVNIDHWTGVPTEMWMRSPAGSDTWNVSRKQFCLRDTTAIRHARQLLYFLYKLELPYEKDDEKKVIDSFVEVEEELKTLQVDPNDAVIKQARKFITRVLGGSDPGEIIPRHGPGAVATGERGPEKSEFARIYRRLEARYPFTEYFQLPGQVCDSYRTYEKNLEELEVGTAKVVLVPKDSRGPRLISCEPLEYQWIQQGQQRKLYGILENHRLTKGHVNFTDQTVNRHLSILGSQGNGVVTLDMKDASDRVSLRLVEELFGGTKWYSYLYASRSPQTRLPDGRIVQLSKFAAMGSAVCFPVEALVFYALAVCAIVVHRQIKPQVARGRVWVYGDDIICYGEDYPVVMQQLQKFGLMFNSGKCCTEGFFRESCGCDAYNGVDVTPIRLRTVWNHHKRMDAGQLVSYVELSNSAYERGYRRLAYYVQDMVEGLYGPLPHVGFLVRKAEHSQELSETYKGRVIGWLRDVSPLAHNLKNCKVRYNRNLQRDEVFGYIIKPKHTRGSDGWGACLWSLNSGSMGPQPGIHTLARRSRLKRGWGAINYDCGYLRHRKVN